MKKYQPYLSWIDAQQDSMRDLLLQWSDINSGSENLDGVERFRQELEKVFAPIADSCETLDLQPREVIDSEGNAIKLPVAQAMRLEKRPDSRFRVFLGGHMDTVFPLESAFQKATMIDENTMHGPGVADLKGGLVVMLTALKAFERSPFSEKIGWEIFFNPDEEIGSPSSAAHLTECGKRNDIGLVFEPSLPDGTLVSERKGSANFTVVVRGKGAHAGRDFFEGANAIYALAEVINDFEQMIDRESGLTVNVGEIEGGGPVNIVPDLAICRLNIRFSHQADTKLLMRQLNGIVACCNQREGISCKLHGSISRGAKPFTKATEALYQAIKGCGESLGMEIKHRATGGVCDGNILAAAGLPTIDTLGVCGDKIHTHDEYMKVDSLVSRARLVALLLMQIANGEITLSREENHDKVTG